MKMKKIFSVCIVFLLILGLPQLMHASCSRCNDTGHCLVCDGIGYSFCSKCLNGRCLNCGGQGVLTSLVGGKIKERDCSQCSDGVCRRCNYGRIDCSSCGGDGVCSSCNGSPFADGDYKVDTPKKDTPTESTQNLKLDCTELTLMVGESHTFSVTGKTNDGFVSVSCDETFFEEATDDFTFTALKPGVSTIDFYTTDKTVKVSCEVTVIGALYDADNILVATIDGVEETFYLTSVNVTSELIRVSYQSYNLRGEERSILSITMGNNLDEGSYSIKESMLHSAVRIQFSRSGETANYCSYLRGGGDGKVGNFLISDLSDDWNVYKGAFYVDLVEYYKGQESICIESAAFQFSISDDVEDEETEIVDMTNTLTATIDGKKQIFYLESAEVTKSTVAVYYTALNPRGEKSYTIWLNIDKNLGKGTYKFSESMLYTDVYMSMNTPDSSDRYCSYLRRGDKTKSTGTFKIESLSRDWKTYKGTFSVKLAAYRGSDSYQIKDAEFNFTIGERHEKLS